MKAIIDFFQNKNYEVTYIIASFNHYTKMKTLVEYPNVIKINVPTYKKNLSLLRLFSHYIFSLRVYNKIKIIQPDLIYCIFPPNTLVNKLAKYKARNITRLVLDCYDLWPESFPYGKYKKLLQIPFAFWKNLRDENLSAADLLLCVSEAGREIFTAKNLHIPIKVLEPTIAQYGLPDYSFCTSNVLTFCYLGNINHITDIKLVVKLLGKIAKQKKVRIHIIGEGENLNELCNNLTILGIEVIRNGITFDMEAKNLIFSNCNFGLNIPKKEVQSSMSLKSIEYLRAGLPFINSGVDDTYEIVKSMNVGINIISDNIDETVKSILGLSDGDLKQMHENCIACYSKYFLNQNLDEVLNSVL
jgi:glycosyltransferase involved in cell wall biosynthesis